MAIDIVLKMLTQGVSAAKTGIQGVKQEVTGVGTEAAKTTDKTDELGTSLASVGKKAEHLESTFTAMRNFGAGLTVVGAGAMALSAHFTKVYKEGEKARQMLEAMATRRGDGGRLQELDEWANKLTVDAAMVDDDPIREAAAGLYGFGLNAQQIEKIMPGLIGQSRLYGQSLQSVAEQFGRAFASGNIGGLTRTGITIDQDTLDKISKINDQGEKQKAIFDAVSVSMEKYALKMNEGMSDVEMQQSRTAAALDSFQDNLGSGTEVATRWSSAFVGGLLNIANAAPGTEHAVGVVIGGVGILGTTIGPAVTALGQLGLGMMGLRDLGSIASRSMELLSSASNFVKVSLFGQAAATDALSISNTSATVSTSTLGGMEMSEAAASNSAALAKSTSAASSDALSISNTSAAISTEALSASQVAATASANSLAAASWGVRLGIAGIAIAAAATVDAVAFTIGQHLGWISKEISFVDSLKLGWQKLGDMILGTQNAAKTKNEIDFKNEEEKIKTQYAKDRQSGMSEEEAGKKRDNALLKLNQTFAKEDNRIGDNENLVKHQEQIDRLQQATKPITVPVVPTVMPPVVAPSGAGIAAAAQLATPAGGGNAPGFIDTSQIKKAAKPSAMAQVANALGGNGGKAYSTINSNGSVTEHAATPTQKITLKPKTRVSQNSAGNYQVEILPETFIIPNPFGQAVGALGS